MLLAIALLCFSSGESPSPSRRRDPAPAPRPPEKGRVSPTHNFSRVRKWLLPGGSGCLTQRVRQSLDPELGVADARQWESCPAPGAGTANSAHGTGRIAAAGLGEL